MVFEAGVMVKDKKGNDCDVKALVDNASLVLVYFSAEWCPPCQGFTPKLAKFYEHVKSEGVVVLFSSCDQSEEAMNDYFKNHHGEYHCIPYKSDLSNALEENCEVSGIPSLCVVDKSGKMLYKGGRSDVESSYTKAEDAKKAVAVMKTKGTQ